MWKHKKSHNIILLNLQDLSSKLKMTQINVDQGFNMVLLRKIWGHYRNQILSSYYLHRTHVVV